MNFLYSLLADFIVWLTSYVGRKAAVGVGVGAVFVAGWVAIQLTIYGLWQGLDFVSPGMVQESMGLLLWLSPSNLLPSVGAVVSARIARWLWDVQQVWVNRVVQA